MHAISEGRNQNHNDRNLPIHTGEEENKMPRKVFGAILSLLMLASLPFPFPVMGSSATVSVQPHITKVWGIGETFMINITVADIINLYGWETKLYFESAFLNCTSVSEGPFLKTAGSTFFNFTKKTIIIAHTDA